MSGPAAAPAPIPAATAGCWWAGRVSRCDEVVGRPGAGNLHLALADRSAGCSELVLVAFDVFAVDQVGDIQHHLAALGEPQLTSSSSGMNSRCIWKLTARAGFGVRAGG